MSMPAEELTPREVVELGAIDPLFYSQYFFPRAFRQGSPGFHTAIWRDLDAQANRFVAVEVFRGGAKTTLLRTFTSRRIAYGLSRTILFVSEAQNHAVRSVEWLKRAVQYNYAWANTFGLEIGGKQSAEELEIIHTVDGSRVRIIALGITGQTRGVNIEDYRPDLIVVDDPCDEENTGTPEQRKKIADLFFGSLVQSLAPASESPDAKVVLLQTPLHGEDLVESALRDPQWVGHRYGCFDENGNSRWPQRWTTEELLAEKAAYIARNQTSLWMREKECRIVSAETASFRPEWLQRWDVLPEGGVTVLSIDPVPPPSEKAIASGMKRKDFEVIHVWKQWKGRRYLCERVANKGHDPEWTIAEFFRLATKWKPMKVGIDGVAYQRTLKWILEQAMKARRHYFQVEVYDDRRKKEVRIDQAYSGYGANREVYVHETHTPFIEQWDAYPSVSHDDELDCGSISFWLLDKLNALDGEWETIDEEGDLPLLEYSRGAP